jgi:hypothetical protein
MSVWHMQPDLAASRRQHKQLYQVQGRYLRYAVEQPFRALGKRRSR